MPQPMDTYYVVSLADYFSQLSNWDDMRMHTSETPHTYINTIFYETEIQVDIQCNGVYEVKKLEQGQT